MSGKSDKMEKPSGSKMLKKAQSFREDIKNRIRRRPSTGVQQMIPSDGKGRKSKGEGILLDSQPVDTEIETLKSALADVNKSLGFIKAVVSRGKMEVLPGSATVILENITDIFNHLRHLLVTQDSTVLASSQNKVCQHLAQFIQWTDDPLLADGKHSDPEHGNDIIESLLQGIKELIQVSLDKISQRKSTLQNPVVNHPLPSSPSSDETNGGCLPKIPLTPREQEILAETDGVIDRSSTTSSVFSFDSTDAPPPKPPLPSDGSSLQNRLHVDTESTSSSLIPPPLPEKKRSPGVGMDALESLSSRSSISSQLSPQSCGAGSTSLISSASLDHSLGVIGGMPPMVPPSPNHHQHHQLLAVLPNNHLSASDLISVSSSSSSSSSSSLSCSSRASSQIMQQEQHSGVVMSSSRSVSRTQSDSKLVSQAAAASVVASSRISTGGGRGAGGKAFQEINQLTSQIKQLTDCIEQTPPPLPAKKNTLNRLNSQYDNVPDSFEDKMAALSSALASSAAVTTSSSQQRTVVMRKEMSRISTSSTSSSQSSQSNQSQSFAAVSNQRTLQSFLAEEQRASSHETYSSSETFSSNSHSSTESLLRPPPLPPKKKHVQAYIQTFGSLKQPGLVEEAISRHSINFYETQWHQHQQELFYPRSNTISVFSNLSSDSSVSGGSTDRLSSPIPPLPIKIKRMSDISHGSHASSESGLSEFSLGNDSGFVKQLIPPESVGQAQRLSLPSPSVVVVQQTSKVEEPPEKEIIAPLAQPEIQKDSDSDFCELKPLDDVDISDQLIMKNENDEGPEVRGGAVDALIIHAAQAGRTEFIYQEAFLTTYRMFISPKALMEKLLYRFYKFCHCSDSKIKLAHNAFSLFIRVVDELGLNEMDTVIIERLMNLVYELICDGSLRFARLLRMKLLEKCEKKQIELEAQALISTPVHSSIELSTSSVDLLSFKAHDIAEQMTLLDAQLFQKIEIPEVLMWAREQSEELSPHLTRFTEHFNNMSFWCRTRILLQDDPREREKYLMKFIKIMRHLRKLHNFNSYLAILSALDSAPVRRLEWPKQNIEALQEFCLLIDSSSSFRAYRQALAETEPPCIPYLGLILQDLTFINIGNQDKLPDGNINFSKHWQQFHILDSMRRFRTGCYELKRSDKIMNMLNNFEDYLNEERLWQISQKIKPRQGHRKQNSIS